MTLSGIRRRIALARARLRGQRRTLIRPRTRLTIEKGGRLEVAELLDLGATLPRGRAYPSQMLIYRGGTVRVGAFVIGTDFRIYVSDGGVLTFGKGVGANHGLEIVCEQSITIGDDCLIGSRVTIRDSDGHSIGGASQSAPVRIGDHVWIATGVTIMPGVTIGDGAIVASGAIVTKDVPARTVVAGIPARVVRENVAWAN
jgi:acetyltransferase-like isoleucine patch superfamily enzyme